MIKSNHSISVVFPCYNDSKTISQLVSQARSVLKKTTNDYEIIVVEDGSTDKSAQILKGLLDQFQKAPSYKNKLKVIFHEKNKGYGGALKSGFGIASKELVFYTDGDGQYDISELPILIALLADDVDFVNGMKIERKDALYRILAGNFHNFMARLAFWLPVYDVDCDFRLIRRELLQKLNLSCNSGAICTELVKKAQRKKAKFVEVSVHHYQRKFGNSQFFKPGRIVHTYGEMLLLWLRLMVVDNFFKS